MAISESDVLINCVLIKRKKCITWVLQHNYRSLDKFAVRAFILPISTVVVAVTYGVVAQAFFIPIIVAAMELIFSSAGGAASNAALVPPVFCPISATAVSIPTGWYNLQLVKNKDNL